MICRQTLVLLAAIASPWVCVAQTPNDAYDTNHDFFDLLCSDSTSTDMRALHVDVDAHGQFDVFIVKDGQRTPVAARTYTNAVTWSESNDQWILDRFKGTLTLKGSKKQLACDRTGGRRF